ncbi:MAG: peptidyl-prolyl cis-trans isomerase [Candidatus Coatesbacteria bacterium]|nr:peptidyl-prolyl cis-trans isomerase [Candidatus Coatesbacteria bacterium]
MRRSEAIGRNIVALCAVVLLVVALLGCGEPEQPTGGAPAPAKKAAAKAPSQPGAIPQSSGEVLARIGDVAITTSDLEQEIADIPVYMQTKFKTKSGKIELLNKMVENELLARAAVEAGLDRDPAVMRKIEDSRKKILQNEYYRSHMKDKVGVPEDQINSYYEAHKDEYKTKARARVRMIMLSDEASANKTLADLKKDPQKFEELAKTRSKDEATASSGGLLGWVTDGGYIRGLGKDSDVNDAIFALKEGQTSEVVKTKKGTFAILKAETIEPASYRPLDEVKRRIADDLLVNDEQIQKYYDENKDEFISKERVKARILVLENESEAKKAKKSLEKGLTVDNFSAYAKKSSIDKTNAKNGGYLGYITRGRYIPGIGRDPAVEKVIFDLNENQMSDPIKTKKGWSIFYVEKKEDAQLKPLDRVKTLITNKLRREMRESAQDESMNSLKQKYGCEIYEDKVTGTEDPDEGNEGMEGENDNASPNIRNVFRPR